METANCEHCQKEIPADQEFWIGRTILCGTDCMDAMVDGWRKEFAEAEWKPCEYCKREIPVSQGFQTSRSFLCGIDCMDAMVNSWNREIAEHEAQGSKAALASSEA